MIYPKETRTYCPYCNSHQSHKAKLRSRGKARTLAFGTRKHNKKLKGHGGKRAGEKTVKKQGKRQTVMLECQKCKKRHLKTITTRTKKKLEIKV